MIMSWKRFLTRCMIITVIAIVALTGATSVQAKKKKNKKVRQAQPAITIKLSENDSKRFNYFFLEAVRQEQMGNSTAAFDLYKHCLNINPQAPEVYFALADYYNAINDQMGMLQCMSLAAEMCPTNDMYLEKLGEAYIRLLDFDNAIGVYEQLSENNPSRTDVLYVLINLYQRMHDNNRTLATLDRLETIEGNSEDITLSKMQVYSLMGDKKNEYRELRELARQHPNDYNYRVMMGNWLLQNDREKDALAEFNTVLKKEPDNIMAQMAMLDYYKKQGQDSLALKLTEQMLLNPNTEDDSKQTLMRQFISDCETEGKDSTMVLGMFDKILAMPQHNGEMAVLKVAYMSMKNMPEEDIKAALERVLEIEPDNVGARYELIQMAWGKKDFKGIIALSKPAIEYNPDNVIFYYFQGLAYTQMDDDDNALETFRKGVGQANETSSKDLVSDLYAITGDILHEKGLEEEAYAAYDSCLQWKPDNIGCLNNYAYYLSLQGKDLAKAEQMSYRTVKAEPNNSTYLDTYAWILFMQERYQEAKIYIDMAVENDSTVSNVIIEHAGDIYYMNNDVEHALEFWNRALGDEENALLEEKIRQRKYIEDNSNK